jgi:hypothetical protein
MEKAKFKLGDKVRVTVKSPNDWHEGLDVGLVGVVGREDNDAPTSPRPWVNFLTQPSNGEGFRQPVWQDHLELVGAEAPELSTTINEDSQMSIQADLVNQNLSDDDAYLQAKGIISTTGAVNDTYALLQDYLGQNKSAIVARLQAAEAKSVARRKLIEAMAEGETPTTTAS